MTLSCPCFASAPSASPSDTPGFFFVSGSWQCFAISAARSSKHFLDVQPGYCARHHTEIRQRGITAADRGNAVADAAELIGLRDLLHLRARIGDGDEAAEPSRPDFSKKYCLKIFGSSVLPDLLETMNSEVFGSAAVFDGLHLRGIGGIENVQKRDTHPACRMSRTALRDRDSTRPCRGPRRFCTRPRAPVPGCRRIAACARVAVPRCGASRAICFRRRWSTAICPGSRVWRSCRCSTIRFARRQVRRQFPGVGFLSLLHFGLVVDIRQVTNEQTDTGVEKTKPFGRR